MSASPVPPPPGAPPASRRPAPRLLALVAAVLAAHAWLVAQWTPGGWRPGSGHGPAPRPVLLVTAMPPQAPRLPVAAPAAAAEDPVPASPPPAPAPVAPPDRADGPRAPDARLDAAVGGPIDAPVDGPSPATAAAPTAWPARPAAAASQAALELDPEAESAVPPPPAEGSPPPVYATRIPLPVLLRYALASTRAAAAPGPGSAASAAPLAGEARLQFRHDGQRYQLQFEAQAGGRPLVEQRSVGGFDPAGLAPERFTDRRRARGAQAANFRRDAGRIGFSGPRIDYPLLPGTQDRLSVLAQLAAIAAAGASGEAGPARLQIMVADARGWVEAWEWQFDGHETVDTPLGSLLLAHWRREPARPEGLRLEAWLDPSRGHWPARLRSTLLRNGQVLDLRLSAEPQPPP